MDATKRDAESRFRELAKKVEQLDVRVKQGGKDMAERYEALMESVRAKREEAEERLREYREAGETKPIRVKQHLDQAIVELRQAYDRVNQAVKSAA